MSAAFPIRCSRLRLTALGLVLLQAGCGGESAESLGTLPRADDPESIGDGVNAYGMRYPLTAAIGEIWGRRTAWPEHFNVDYLLTNGPFTVTPITPRHPGKAAPPACRTAPAVSDGPGEDSPRAPSEDRSA